MSRRRSPRSSLYRAARVLGDVEAAERGPVSYGKRRARRVAYKTVNRTLARVLRSVGL